MITHLGTSDEQNLQIDYGLLSVLSSLGQIAIDIETIQALRAQVALDNWFVTLGDAQLVVDIFAAISSIGSYQPPSGSGSGTEGTSTEAVEMVHKGVEKLQMRKRRLPMSKRRRR